MQSIELCYSGQDDGARIPRMRVLSDWQRTDWLDSEESGFSLEDPGWESCQTGSGSGKIALQCSERICRTIF